MGSPGQTPVVVSTARLDAAFPLGAVCAEVLGSRGSCPGREDGGDPLQPQAASITIVASTMVGTSFASPTVILAISSNMKDASKNRTAWIGSTESVSW